jgi:hypothetical protein
MNHYVALSLTSRKSSVHLHALYSPRTALRTFTPRRDQLVIWGRYLISLIFLPSLCFSLLSFFIVSFQARSEFKIAARVGCSRWLRTAFFCLDATNRILRKTFLLNSIFGDLLSDDSIFQLWLKLENQNR